MNDLELFVTDGGRTLRLRTSQGRMVPVRELLKMLEIAESAILDGVGLRSEAVAADSGVGPIPGPETVLIAGDPGFAGGREEVDQNR